MIYAGYKFEVKNGSIHMDDDLPKLEGIQYGDVLVYCHDENGNIVLVNTTKDLPKFDVDFKSHLGDLSLIHI